MTFIINPCIGFDFESSSTDLKPMQRKQQLSTTDATKRSDLFLLFLPALINLLFSNGIVLLFI